MPGASFHSFFWAEDAPSSGGPAIGASASGGYVPWQTSIITAMSVGVLCLQSWAPVR